MRTYISEFPDFGCLDVELPFSFKDTSWHNDAMPSFTKQLENGQTLVLWIDYADKEKREYDFYDRFSLFWKDADEEVLESWHSDEMQYMALVIKIVTLTKLARQTLLGVYR